MMSCRTTVSRLLMFALFLLLATAAQALPPVGGDPCDGFECNHGSCVSPGGSPMCECNGGWTGAFCDVNIDECESNPCINGVCIDGAGEYSCSCLPGWTGTNCEADIDECLSEPCLNGGDCTDLINAYSCSCPPGWTGRSCEIPVVTLDCSGAVASPGLLWPPNHQLVPISVIDVIDPNHGTVTVTITGVSQDEPVNGLGDGDTSPDATGVGTANAAVRSERAGNGDGRVYHITFSATSTSGSESCTGTVTVGVPKSQGNKGGPVDGGALHDSTQP